ncbi:MAG TPA: tetratricopeptide repeat protein [Verrucomicrobiae bacterium]|nr:tetratricopeptide repeat protein [Verrucomicrobiae bacterium]
MLALVVAAIWFTSGYDPKLTGDGNRDDLIRRITRCFVTLLLLALLLILPGAEVSVPALLALCALMAILWVGCLTEMLSRGVHYLTGFASSHREFDPDESAHNLERVASLLREGRRDDAARLAEWLRASGEGDVPALDALLDRAGVPHERVQTPAPLAEADRLCVEGKFAEAATILKSSLAKNPAGVDAALMLMRIYARDLRQGDKAAEILRSLEKQPHVPSACIEFAARSIHEWGQKKIEPKAAVLPESVDELVAAGYPGTAIEILEEKIKQGPDDFETNLKMAEIYGRNCGDLRRAEKIIERVENNLKFTPEQIQLAKSKLREWRDAGAFGH